MSIHRRKLLCAAVAALCLPVLAAAPAQAADWPTKPVRLIVAYPPGGATDIQARLVGQRLSEQWQQPVIVENRPGGNTVIATNVVAMAEPDGHTLLLTAMPFALNPLLMDSLPYDSARDLAPVTVLTTISNVLVAAPDAGIRNVPELIARAKAEPGALSFASTGVATSTHLSGELFSSMAGVELTHVPYKGSAPAHQDLLSGRIQIMFDNGVLQHIESGRVVPLGVTSAERLPWLPEVPTVAEQGLAGFEASAWYGIFATGGTPPEVLDSLAADITAAVRAPELQPRLQAIGASPGGGTPEEFRQFLDQETERWGKLVRERDIRLM
ncbi:tripartite tricarboxylate transporter substrate binding protein [Verticiella sediminum]|uniref:Tripartite tricarboxylate transporter substrate binding protein n=1 Tax=Verticiella sediminum TaxID=1247510 RepID=A0A556B0W3_9BURK|nr:tripartite tricarboxylate transporter substrate binding protein [Verticiella sediminum]TSH98837.1 tripartite tricarboxylate transporter substrate binding protein [Verticiella sediminum]